MPKSSSGSPSERLVINTGPLIALAKAEALDVIGQLPLRVLCPQQVRAELDAGGRGGFSEITPSWLEVKILKQPLDPMATATLDAGEAAVIQLATEHEVERVCIDEKRGRRVASAIGLQVVGTLGLLLRAKTIGVIPSVRPFLDRLRRAGEWYDAGLIDRVLRAAGEID